MAETWSIPEHTEVIHTGTEWLLHLLAGKTENQCMKILMLLWRIWHVRNEVIHHKPAPPIEASRRFLCSYVESLLINKQHPQADCVKGKMVVETEQDTKKGKRSLTVTLPPKRWCRPPEGYLKLNVDGSFHEESETGGTWMILRDGCGEIIFSACRNLGVCTGALDAELAACMEGLALAMQRTELPIIVEMDCAVAVTMINGGEEDRSPMAFLVREIKALLCNNGRVRVECIRREQNLASHALANLGRVSAITDVWLGTGPADIPKLCREDCNPDA